MTFTRVVGIDLSLTSTGLAEVTWDSNLGASISVQRIQSKGAAAASLADRARRLRLLANGVTEWAGGADLAVIEGPSFGQARQGGQHDRAGLWWLVVDCLRVDYDVTVVEVPPSVRAKYATGAGNAAKDAVLAAAVKRYPNTDITGNDVADAVILAAMGARHLGQPADSLPQIHLQAMAKVHWPNPSERTHLP